MSALQRELNPVTSQQHCKVAQATLSTLSAYVDWVGAQYLFEGNGLLLQMLCLMLQDSHLQLLAAECLLVIANRRVRGQFNECILICDSVLSWLCRRHLFVCSGQE